MLAPALPFAATTRRRQRLRVRGLVQGVGFRPFVWQLAQRFGLSGHVSNDGEGVIIEAEGEALEAFVAALRGEAPAQARISRIEAEELPPSGGRGFAIVASRGGAVRTRIGPDLAICEACTSDIQDPASRFHGYAFTTCTRCGPRYTLTYRLPYDRASTSMASFALCPACTDAYENPADRRFHAEPLACPRCGPQLSHDLARVAASLAGGGIVALKGLGGYHLLCNARDEAAVQRLRARKQREAKPFAVMVANLDSARLIARPSAAEEALFLSDAAPAVLMDGRGLLAPSLAPGLTRLAVMRSATPLHVLLLAACAKVRADLTALVATSANVSGRPLIADDDEARRDLAAIADLIVTHDRAVAVRCDDSVMQVIDGAPSYLRRARGAVPEPILLAEDGPDVVAFGGDLKNTLCVTRGREAFLSQHIGGLDNAETLRFQRETLAHLTAILDVTPQGAACDAHPDFRSVRLAEASGLPLARVPHHQAHVAAVAAEHGLTGAVLGLALDGHGYGPEGGATGPNWGGEMLRLEGTACTRLGHLAPLPLPGGDKAAREPWRMGLAVLHALGLLDRADALFGAIPGASALAARLAQGLVRERTTSLGRLFDAVAALSGLRHVQAFEGQAAMELEACAKASRALPEGFSVTDGVLDVAPVLRSIVMQGLTPRDASELFHGTLMAGLAALAGEAARAQGHAAVLLSGGCFQNRRLAEGLCAALRAWGLTPLLPQQAPANDGGLALGQALIARRLLQQGE